MGVPIRFSQWQSCAHMRNVLSKAAAPETSCIKYSDVTVFYYVTKWIKTCGMGRTNLLSIVIN